MWIEVGHFAVLLALLLTLLGMGSGFAALKRHDTSLASLSLTAAPVGFGLILVGFASLTSAFLADDFSVDYVANNSNIDLPLQYKVSAVWGAHEGSFLLWCLVMAGWMMAVARLSDALALAMRLRVMIVLYGLQTCFLLFLLFASSPFERSLPFYPSEGADLNPLLQDFGLIVHPPLLYMGYVGLSVPFAFAIASLWSGTIDLSWTKWSRPWTNVAWAFLTAGITLGSWWAYYELGWGGWWFWDAVENASFMPWLLATALVHSLAATEKRGVFKSWTLLLAIGGFSFSLLGAFLVRSGVLTSVHAFAVDPERGLAILAFLVPTIGGSLLLYALRARHIKTSAAFALSSRESFILGNNVLLAVSTLMILLGTIYPLIYEAATGGLKISVGPPYFNTLFIPLTGLLLVLLMVGHETRWRETNLSALFRGQRWQWAVAIAVTLSVLFWLDSLSLAQALFLFLGVNIVVGLTRQLAERVRMRRQWLVIFRQSPSYYSMLSGHIGLSLMVIGIAATSVSSIELDVRMAPKESVTLGNYVARFEGVRIVEGPNYTAERGEILVTRDDEFVARLFPEKRRYHASQQVMTEAAIDAGFSRDLYVALGEPLSQGAWSVRLQEKPLVRWIWLGGMLVAFSGLVSLIDHRYRRRVTRPKAPSVMAEAG